MEEQLIEAVESNDYIRVSQLLRRGADPNTRENWHNSPVLYLATGLQNKLIIQMLLEAGADPNLVNKFNRTALFLASQRGLRYIVELLLAKGADPNIVDINGLTPLEAAAKNAEQFVRIDGYTDTVYMLLPITNRDTVKKVITAAENNTYQPYINKAIIEYQTTLRQKINRFHFEEATRSLPGYEPTTVEQLEHIGPFGTHKVEVVNRIANFLGPPRGGRRRHRKTKKRISRRRKRTMKRRA
jgi:hypothetical protein